MDKNESFHFKILIFVSIFTFVNGFFLGNKLKSYEMEDEMEKIREQKIHSNYGYHIDQETNDVVHKYFD